MGVGRLGFGQLAAGPKAVSEQPRRAMGFGSTGSKKTTDGGPFFPAIQVSLAKAVLCLLDEGERYAREKFGTQKGISSDEFFGRNAYDPHAQSEARTRLHGFEGASSISSNQYFGRPEDEVPDSGDYGDLEATARDFIRRVWTHDRR